LNPQPGMLRGKHIRQAICAPKQLRQLPNVVPKQNATYYGILAKT
jgi:hypothetical protein